MVQVMIVVRQTMARGCGWGVSGVTQWTLCAPGIVKSRRRKVSGDKRSKVSSGLIDVLHSVWGNRVLVCGFGH